MDVLEIGKAMIPWETAIIVQDYAELDIEQICLEISSAENQFNLIVHTNASAHILSLLNLSFLRLTEPIHWYGKRLLCDKTAKNESNRWQSFTILIRSLIRLRRRNLRAKEQSNLITCNDDGSWSSSLRTFPLNKSSATLFAVPRNQFANWKKLLFDWTALICSRTICRFAAFCCSKCFFNNRLCV